ncbi:hypothetical protein LSH36_294g03058 [Paralvinella palmiformis]|uniref:SHSP domain-containing protein n=1 Tax=Paralvinella palmiformis TaxID=53620 RepID=A0AAD9JIC8_9ANNE|nr:hypothetical protein LSH36_294g03058 [Paralvinella palmiformis]
MCFCFGISDVPDLSAADRAFSEGCQNYESKSLSVYNFEGYDTASPHLTSYHMASAPRGIPKAANRRVLSVQSGVEMSRSPKESPPTIKKKLCRPASGSLLRATSQLDPALTSPRPKTASGRSPSILKKAPPGGYTASSCASPTAEARRVQFQQHVTVFLMSDSGDVFCSECQQLSGDFTENRQPRAAYAAAPGYYVIGDRNSSKSPVVLASYDDEDDELSRVDYRFVDDIDRGTIVKFVLPLGPDYKPEDIVVKANVSGSRIRLVANRPVAYPDRSVRIEQVSRRFNLPVQVDPYMVMARLDIKGNLTVEAPLLRVSRRQDTVASQPRLATLKDISNKTAHSLIRR